MARWKVEFTVFDPDETYGWRESDKLREHVMLLLKPWLQIHTVVVERDGE